MNANAWDRYEAEVRQRRELEHAREAESDRATANDAIAAIVEDLSDRRGLGHEWRQIDEDVLVEILTTWRNILYTQLQERRP